jgi:hypothetical protein
VLQNMKKNTAYRWCVILLFEIALISIGQILPAKAQQQLYKPVALPTNQEISDTLSEKDIPTGEGGFARDYSIKLEEGDQVAIDLHSEDFDTMVMLIAADGSTLSENDDGPDGTTSSLLFARITETGEYVVRVRAFGETGGGKFKLKITRLRPVDN